MKEKKYSLSELIFLFYVIYGVLTCTVPVISKFLSRYIMIVNFLVGAYFFGTNIKKYNTKKVLSVTIAILNLIIGAFINNTGYGSLLTITTMYLLFMYVEKINIRSHCMTSAVMIVMIGEVLFLIADKTNYNTNTIGYISFAMIIFITLLYMSIKHKNILIHLCFITFLIINIVYIYHSDSRASLLGLITFGVLLIFSKMLKNKKIFKIMILLIVIGTITFPYTYVNLYKKGVSIDLDYGNKRFYSGRQVIWGNMIRDFKGKELYGLGSNYRAISKENSLNVHNSVFAIYMIYGILNFCIFLPMFINFIWNMHKNIESKTSRVAISGIIAMLIISYFETNLIWGNTYMIFVLLSCMAYGSQETKEQGIEQAKYELN